MPAEKSILIVDDEAEIRFTLADILRTLGYEVRVASSAVEALRTLQAQQSAPSVIVLDLMMPVMDGYQFREEQQRDPKLAKIPVIIITAGMIVRQEALQPFGVVDKPIKLPALCAMIEKAMISGVQGRPV